MEPRKLVEMQKNIQNCGSDRQFRKSRAEEEIGVVARPVI